MPGDDEVDVGELYAADPDEFVARRQALVKQLKGAGERDKAAEVGRLRRPTAAAWAVNQLARRHSDELDSLLDLGRQLEEAHEGLLAGASPDRAVALGRSRREAIAGLTDRAMAVLAESGRATDPHRDAVAHTLDAASLDSDAAAVVRAGRLSRELDPPSGFGLDWVADDWSPPPRPPAGRATDASPPDEADDADEADESEDEDARRAAQQQAAANAEARAREAQDRAVAAAEAAARAEATVERLEEELDDARLAARAARRAAAEAATQAKKALAEAAKASRQG